MQYLVFSFWFIVIHTAAYTIAGASALRFSGDLYRGPSRLYDFVRDMDDATESKHVQKWFLPAQVLRGLLFSVVFYPAMGALSDLSFPLVFLFVFGLLFVFSGNCTSRRLCTPCWAASALPGSSRDDFSRFRHGPRTRTLGSSAGVWPRGAGLTFGD